MNRNLLIVGNSYRDIIYFLKDNNIKKIIKKGGIANLDPNYFYSEIETVLVELAYEDSIFIFGEEKENYVSKSKIESEKLDREWKKLKNKFVNINAIHYVYLNNFEFDISNYESDFKSCDITDQELNSTIFKKNLINMDLVFCSEESLVHLPYQEIKNVLSHSKQGSSLYRYGKLIAQVPWVNDSGIIIDIGGGDKYAECILKNIFSSFDIETTKKSSWMSLMLQAHYHSTKYLQKLNAEIFR